MSNKLVCHSKFQEAWDEIVSPKTLPRRCREVHEIGYPEFRKKVLNQESDFVRTVTRSIYEGDAFLIRGAYTRSFMEKVKRDVFEYWKRTPSSFHKMLEGSPDFHRVIDVETGKKYSFPAVKHSCYFYPWNSDPLGLFKPVWERWSLCKFLSGQRLDEYQNNTPKDGVVDRIQIVQYPSGEGMLATHSDPYLHQKLIISGYMSKRGEDFKTGGFYMVDQNNQKVDIEDRIEVGDMLVAYATVLHGVAAVDADKKLDWDSMDGRWFLSMYSNASDEVAERHTGYAVNIEGA